MFRGNPASPTVQPLEPRRLLSTSDLDPTFGDAGRVDVDLGRHGAFADLVVQPDRKLLVAGTATALDGTSTDAIVMRFRPDGARDATFGTNGLVRFDRGGGEQFFALALRPDGKIVAGGRLSSTKWALAQYNSNGSVDTSFGGGDGVATGTGAITDLALQGQKIITADGGDTVRRYASTGTTDATFGNAGSVVFDFDRDYVDSRLILSQLQVQPDGKILVGGNETEVDTYGPNGGSYNGIETPVVIRLEPNGAIDTTFNGGVAQPAVAEHKGVERMALHQDGTIVTLLAGTDVAQVGPDGRRDLDFGRQPGVEINDDDHTVGLFDLGLAGALTIDSSNRTIAASASQEATRVARLRPNGLTDWTLSPHGVASADVVPNADEHAAAVAVTSDGGVVVIGHATFGRDADPARTPLLAKFRGAYDGRTQTAELVEGILRIGGSDVDDRIWISQSADGQWVNVGIQQEDESFPADEIRQIRVELDDGNDWLGSEYGWWPSGTDLPLRVDGGDGKDILNGGRGSDSIYGGSGNDRIWAHDGNDFVSGNGGKDTIYGGGGKDRLNGHGGHDRLYGEADADRLYGYDGYDLLDGGASNDRLYGGDGVDLFYGQGGNDVFSARDGVVESLFGASGVDRAEADLLDVPASIEQLAAF